jgi:hypothetical protein
MNKVGQLLANTRNSLGISIDDASKRTKIQKLYLEAIEKGDFAFFKNQEFYQQVFVGSYASFLGLDKNGILSDLQEDNKSYLANPISDAFMPKTADEILEYDKKVEVASEVVLDDTLEKEVEEPEVEVAPEVESIIEDSEEPQNTHSNPKVLKKYMYGVEDPKLKEIEERIKQQKMQKELDEAFDNFSDNVVQDDDSNVIEDTGVENVSAMPELELDPEIETEHELVIDEVEPKETEKDISQLLDEIDANHEQDDETLLDEEESASAFFNQETPIKEEPDNNILHSNLLDEINNINEEAVQKKTEISILDDIMMEQDEVDGTKLDEPNQLDSTAVIDLTSGIEMEQVSNDKIQDREGLIANIDESLNVNSSHVINDDDPSRTSMDLKVAKA